MIEDVKEAFRLAFTFRFKELARTLLFRVAFVGVIGFIIQATVFEIFGLQLELLRPRNAALLGAELAVINNFLIHNFITFADRRIPVSTLLLKKFIYFNLVVGISLLIQWIAVSIGESVADGSFLILRSFNILGVLLGFVFNYLNYTKIIWRSANTSEI